MPNNIEAEVKIAREDNALAAGVLDLGVPSTFSCPECSGVLMQLKESANLRFRCHTGHGYTAEALLTEISEQTEATLWNAVRSIEEAALLMRRMAGLLREHRHHTAADDFEARALAAHNRSELLRTIVMQGGSRAPGAVTGNGESKSPERHSVSGSRNGP